jgi:hypothetical protein
MVHERTNHVATHEVGKANEQDLNTRIEDAWRKALLKDKSGVATALQVDEDKLDPDVPPFKARVSGSGLTGAEVAIVFATAFIAAFAKDMGTAAGKAAAKRFRKYWEEYLQEKVSPPGSGELGDLKD